MSNRREARDWSSPQGLNCQMRWKKTAAIKLFFPDLETRRQGTNEIYSVLNVHGDTWLSHAVLCIFDAKWMWMWCFILLRLVFFMESAWITLMIWKRMIENQNVPKCMTVLLKTQFYKRTLWNVPFAVWAFRFYYLDWFKSKIYQNILAY